MKIFLTGAVALIMLSACAPVPRELSRNIYWEQEQAARTPASPGYPQLVRGHYGAPFNWVKRDLTTFVDALVADCRDNPYQLGSLHGAYRVRDPHRLSELELRRACAEYFADVQAHHPIIVIHEGQPVAQVRVVRFAERYDPMALWEQSLRNIRGFFGDLRDSRLGRHDPEQAYRPENAGFFATAFQLEVTIPDTGEGLIFSLGQGFSAFTGNPVGEPLMEVRTSSGEVLTEGDRWRGMHHGNTGPNSGDPRYDLIIFGSSVIRELPYFLDGR